jgi:hypothetical protein
MINLKEHGFEQIGDYWVLREGIYVLIHSKKNIINKIFNNNPVVDVLELYAENKDEDMILLGEIEGEESLKTILTLIKNKFTTEFFDKYA